MTLTLPRRRRTAVPVPHLPVPVRVHGRPRTRRQLRDALDAAEAGREAATDTVDRLNDDLEAVAKELKDTRLKQDVAEFELRRHLLRDAPAEQPAIEAPRPPAGISVPAPADTARDSDGAAWNRKAPEDQATMPVPHVVQPITPAIPLQTRGPLTVTWGQPGGAT
jgi:hypothetical protein